MRWFEYNIRSIFFFTPATAAAAADATVHSFLAHTPARCVSSLIVVLRISRACFILKYNFEQILCVFFFSISFSLNFSSHF